MKVPNALSGYDHFSLQCLFFGATVGFVYPSLIINSTHGSYWAPIAAWSLAAMCSCWLYSRLLARLSGKGLITVLVGTTTAGKCLGLLVTIPIILFIAFTLSVMLRAYSELVTMTMLPTTPILFLNGMIVASGALAWAGLMPIVRAAKIITLLCALLMLLLIFAGVFECHWELGQPWFKLNFDFLRNKHFYAGSFIWMGFIYTAVLGTHDHQSAKAYRNSYGASIIVGAA